MYGPDKVAVIYGRRRLIYSEFAAEVERVARALRASGVEPGDRVAYLMPNLPEMLIAHFAVPLAGGMLVATNTRLTAHEVSHILRHSRGKIVVTDAALLPTAAAAANDVDTVTRLVVAADTEAEPASADPAAEVPAAGPRLVSYPEFLARQAVDPMSWSVQDELAAAGSTAVISASCTPTGISNCATAPRTSSSPAGKHSTIEVEQALMSHPCVLEAAVIGVPDEKWGERPKAFVVLRPGASTTVKDLTAHVRTKLAGDKAPRDIDITVKLPKTSTGKIQKYMLREKEWAGHAHRVQG